MTWSDDERGPVSETLQRPSGFPPPDQAVLAGRAVDLVSLAQIVTDRHFIRHPEDLERYGEDGRAWCVHDAQHLLNWAILDVNGFVDLEEQVAWLTRVLHARGYPLANLADNVETAAEVVAEQLGAQAEMVAERLRRAAGRVTA